MLTPDDIIRINEIVEGRVSQERAAFSSGFQLLFEAARSNSDKKQHPSRANLLQNYRTYNATAVGRIVPAGTLFITDAGTTPARSIALVYSDGKAHFNLISIVV